MTYEKDIPDYALVPAKEPEERILIPITQGAIYSPVQVTNISEKPKATISIEEDILVPDTKPDLKEILMIDGCVHLANREAETVSKNEEHLSIAGDIELQTLYIPEKQEINGSIISTSSRVSFKEQWHTPLAQGATVVMEGRIEKIEYMVINERKYRVKIHLGIFAREYQESKIDIFEGITNEEIQTLKEKVEITNVALRKKDILTIHEEFESKESEGRPETILKQDISVVENYKQATGEKVIINGFIYVNLLYGTAPVDDEGEKQICQLQERVEFTQFIPIQLSGQWSGSNITFDGNNLNVKLVLNEDGDEQFSLDGDIVTYLELYKNVERDIIVDAYHREKDFICDFTENSCRTLVGNAVGETSVREIISMESSGGEAEKVCYVTGEIPEWKSVAEIGKVVTEGTLKGKLLCKYSGEGEKIFAINQSIPFRCITTVPQLLGNEIVSDRVYMKDLWAEKINSKQVELNATILVTSEIMRPTPFKVLGSPAFEQQKDGKRSKPMVVYIAKQGDDLWTIAKKFKTTIADICKLNELVEEGGVSAGQKLLILN